MPISVHKNWTTKTSPCVYIYYAPVKDQKWHRAISRWLVLKKKKMKKTSILKVCFAQGCWPYSNTQKTSKQKREIRILFSKAWLTWFSIRILLAPAMTWSWCEARNITKFHSWPQPLWSWRYAMFMPDIQAARQCLQHQQDKVLVGVVYSQSWWLLLAKLQQLNI